MSNEHKKVLFTTKLIKANKNRMIQITNSRVNVIF